MLKCIALAAALTGSASAQTPAVDTQTVVTSEQFKLDMAKKEGVFTGNVEVKSRDFTLKSSEIVVYFAASGGKVERLVARGNVTIDQDNRTAKANQAEYNVAEDKIILSGAPEVIQNKNKVAGTTITIYRGDNRMQVEGRTKMTLFEELSKTDAGGK
jgi:lipopolysaccharide export system protein LptA